MLAAAAPMLASAVSSAGASTMTSKSIGPDAGGGDAPSGRSMAAGIAGRSVDGKFGFAGASSTRRMLRRCEADAS